MNSPAAIFVAIAIAIVGLAFLLLLFRRAISWAKKRQGGAEFFGGSFSVGSALNPAEAIVEERRRVKRSEDGSGDPDESDT